MLLGYNFFMNKKTSLISSILLLVGISILGYAATGNAPPDFSVTDASGTTLTLSKLKGKVVLLDFWATWCPPCRAEVPNLIDIQKSFGDRKFVLISVSLDRDLDAARRFVKEKGMNWVHVIDGAAAGALAEKYQIRYIPSTFVIDREGNMAASQLRGGELKDKIAALLK
jgi:thiol-disulfide isomerase/thioredoxin